MKHIAYEVGFSLTIFKNEISNKNCSESIINVVASENHRIFFTQQPKNLSKKRKKDF